MTVCQCVNIFPCLHRLSEHRVQQQVLCDSQQLHTPDYSQGLCIYIYDYKFDDLSTIAYNSLLKNMDKYKGQTGSMS